MGDTLISIIPDMKRRTVQAFVDKAQALDRPLLEKRLKPLSLVRVAKNERGNAAVAEREDIGQMQRSFLEKVIVFVWILVTIMWGM